jgi:Ca2+-binding RTX toxin-like protein
MRRILLLATTILFAVLVIGGAAYALTFTCNDPLTDPDPGGECTGTIEGDIITGTTGGDRILAGQGDDTVDARRASDLVIGNEGDDTLHGRSGSDELYGESEVAEVAGDDTLFGESSGDLLIGRGGNNEYFGASGPDEILANESGTGETETVSAGPGNDRILAEDGAADDIDCGRGRDQVDVGPGDTTSNCEITINP